MNNEDKILIAEATKSLRLLDIVLYECSSRRPNDLPLNDDTDYRLMHRRNVEFNVQKVDGKDVLVVKVQLGVRLIDRDSEEEDQNVYSEIQTDYLVFYDVSKPLSQECFQIFSEYNAVHNVWSFWRQHVFDLVLRSKLPHIDIPLLSGTLV